jgi:tRNA 2-thiouridine synthesizing protein A
MSQIVDARGLSCPQPVIMTLEVMKKVEKGEIQVLVDTDTSKENVSRAAENQGWEVKEIKEEGGEYRITLQKD